MDHTESLASKLLTFRSNVERTLSSLSGSGLKLGRYVLEHPEDVMNGTTYSLSQKVKVSAPTVIRFCKACGYDGFTDMKMSVRREYERYRKMTADNSSEETGRASLSVIKKKTMGVHMHVIESVLDNWNEEAFSLAADEILHAKHILITAYGGSRAAALALTDFLLLMNLSAEICSDPSFTDLKISLLREEDLLIGITFTGRYIQTVQEFRLAGRHHVPTIVITGFTDSEICKYAGLVLQASLPEQEFTSSTLSARISEMAVVEIIYSLLEEKHGYSEENTWRKNQALEFGRIPSRSLSQGQDS